jgi:hypothetical protein
MVDCTFATPMAINGFCRSQVAIEPRAGQPGMVGDILCHARNKLTYLVLCSRLDGLVENTG